MVPTIDDARGILERFFSPEEIAFLLKNDEFSHDFARAKAPEAIDQLLMSGFALIRSLGLKA